MAERLTARQRQRILDTSDDFETWREAYRQEEAVRGGRSFINGVPAEKIVGTGSPILPANPVSNRNLVMANAERLSNQAAADQFARGVEQENRYNSFLQERGINPDSIGTAMRNGRGGLSVPSLAQQQLAVDLKDQAAGNNARARIAANELRRRDPRAWYAGMEAVDSNSAYRGGRSAERNLQYWMNRLNQTITPTYSANGYASTY